MEFEKPTEMEPYIRLQARLPDDDTLSTLIGRCHDTPIHASAANQQSAHTSGGSELSGGGA